MADQSEIALVAMRRILKATEANVKALAQQSGVTASQLLALQMLVTHGEMLVGDLARMLDLRHATISILLDKLQELGLIVRRKHDSDRRKVWVRITPVGIERLRGAPDLLQTRFRKRFEELAEWEQAMLVSSLMRIVVLLGAARIDASPLLDIGDLAELPRDDSDL
jgi:MarR family transcriptional regulator, organic hydroperoxide resistance regulator